jgi:sigma-B regulation protein RsbU (phosphoserine phosphatase)
VKSGARTALDANPAPQQLLPTLNGVLTHLMPPESYVVTCAALAGGADARLQVGAAGHPPLIYYTAASGQVSRVGVENLPLGLFASVEFATLEVQCAPGDMQVLYTDGMREIFQAGGAEFGVDGLGAVLRAHAASPLADCVAAMQAATRAWGPQTDDQMLLLLRYAPSGID